MEPLPSQAKRNIISIKHVVLIVFVIILISFSFLLFFFRPIRIKEDSSFTVSQGTNLRDIAKQAQDQGFISSPIIFEIMSRLQGVTIQAGRYQFDSGTYSLFQVLKKLSNSEQADSSIKIIIPEGSTNTDIANILTRSELIIDKVKFTNEAKNLEGYLFPDTYYFLPDDDVEKIIATLRENFQLKISKHQDLIEKSPYTLDEIITMASIIEREATGNQEEMQIVSGILWKRIREGMRLQVDAPFMYTLGKRSDELTLKDLASDSPYNTYRKKGLTPTPIGNPGIQAIYAALNPIESSYYFYLHDSRGTIHYAKDHDGHIRNKNQYLR